MKEIFIHIGLHKTATTFLQTKVFPCVKDLYYVGISSQDISKKPFNFFYDINQKTTKDSKLSNKEIIKIKGEINDFINNLGENCFLFSHEGLSDGYLQNYSNSYQNAILIKELFENSKIIFVIRKQSDWAESQYNQHITRNNSYSIEDYGGPKDIFTINEYFGYKNGCFKEGKYFNIKDLNWNHMVKNYIEIFGKENVLVLPYELLKENLNEFLRRFYDFTGFSPYYPENIDYINQKPDINTIKYCPLLSKYSCLVDKIPEIKLKSCIKKNDRGIKKFLSKYIKFFDISNEKFNEQQKNLIMEIHKESNEKLSELININLKEFRYY